MHIYIYDSFLNQKKYDRILAILETRITDLGLNGKISRLSIMKNLEEIIDYEIKRGAKTIVAVGNDGTVNRVVKALVGTQIPLAIIPIEENNIIANSLGINSLAEACSILSARRIIKIDLASASDLYFLSSAEITNRGTTMEISKNFSIEIMEKGTTNVFNLLPVAWGFPKNFKSNPQDGILELIIRTDEKRLILAKNKSGQSIFPIKKLIIKNEKFPVLLDGSIEIKPPVEISVLKQKLNVIVGKNRNF